MNLALILLQTGETLVAQTEQLEYEPQVHMFRPYLVTGKDKIVLSPWPYHAKDQHILLHSTSLLTICDPSEKLRSAYMTKAKLTEEDLKPKPVPVILSEEENIPDLLDDYEPQYLEES